MLTRRDLLDPTDGVRDARVRDVVERERADFLGAAVGWEVRREIVGRLTFQPRLPTWARADFGIQTRFLGERDPGLVRFGADSIPTLLRNAGGERDLRASLTLEPETLMAELLGAEPEPQGFARILAEVFGAVVSPLTLSVQDGVTARYDREDVDPGVGVQLGFAGAGSYRNIDRVVATDLVDRTALSAGSGLRLPGSVFANVNYQTSLSETLDRRSERESRVRTWPDVRVGIAEIPVPEGWSPTVPRVSLSVGFQRTEREVIYGGEAVQRRLRGDASVPVEAALEWVSGLIARYRGQVGWGTGEDPTGETERTSAAHGLSIETRVAPRGGLGDRVVEPLRLSIVLDYAATTECRMVTGQSTCVDFIDQLNRGASVAVDTEVSGIEVGAQLSLVDRRSFTGLQTSYTQFQLGIWGRMVFEAGPIGRLSPSDVPF